MKKIIYLFILLLAIININCSNNEFSIDVSEVNLELDIYRFDETLFMTEPQDFFYEIPKIQENYGDFFDIYNMQIIGIGRPEQKDYYNKLTEFLDYCEQVQLYDSVMNLFPENSSFLIDELTNAFKHYKYYFGDAPIPKIITCISGFNLSVFTGADFIGISLDKYLGSNYELYNKMFEQYLSRRMNKNMVASDVMRAWSIAEFPYNDSVNTVLTNSIYQGRIQYFLDAMLPNTNDTLKWGYSEANWGWVNSYEQNIWDYLVDQKLLFSHETMTIKTYTDEAPFTTPFGNDSAPKAGNFIGYKIVKAYMENNENITLKQLMNERDYMKIYNNSYYQPE